jgi:hypothetical protein
MHRLNELAAKLTPAQLQEVEDFAEFLLVRRDAKECPAPDSGKERKISFEGWAGCMADVHPELSDSQFNELIMDEWARAAED